MNKIRKIIIAPKAIYSSRKLIKNLYSSLYQYLILRKQNIELELINGDTICISRFLYPRIIYYYYLGYLNDINKNEISFKIDNKVYSLPINVLSSNNIGGIILLIKSNWQYKNDYWEKMELNLSMLMDQYLMY
jgi:hypothetical protein